MNATALALQPWIGPPTVGPATPVRPDPFRSRPGTAPAEESRPERVERVPLGLVYDAATFGALRGSGPGLAFAAQLYTQTSDMGPETVPAAYAAKAYQATAATRFGFMGFMDPFDVMT